MIAEDVAFHALVDAALRSAYGTASSGNYGHSGRPGEVGGSGPAQAVETHEATPAEAKSFVARFESAFKDSEYAAFVSHYTAEEIVSKGMISLTANGGKTGLLIHDHGDGRIEATALYNTSDVKGAGIKLLKEAIQKHGVNYVEAYGPYLPALYKTLGFVSEQQYRFDPLLADPKWNHKKFDEPDYHYMRLAKGTVH